MIEDTIRRNQRERQLARRRGVAPSQHLRRHFLSLARQVIHWAHERDDSRADQGVTSIGVTSLTKGAGKSTISFNLAAALTPSGHNQILLAESDFGNPYISRRLGLAKNPGLGEAMVGDAEFKDVVYPTPLTGLSVMGCGLRTDQGSLDLPFDALPHIVAEHFNEFGFVIFDLPVADDLSACHAITPHMDGIILTVESNQLDQRMIERFRKQIEEEGSQIVGVVINKA